MTSFRRGIKHVISALKPGHILHHNIIRSAFTFKLQSSRPYSSLGKLILDANRSMVTPLKLPKYKVELHVHLDGAVRLSTIIDLARKKGKTLPVNTAKKLRQYVSVDIDKVTPDCDVSLTKFLECFEVFMPLIIGDENAIERIAYEFCEDQAANGVFYFEGRYAPHLLANCGFDGIKETKEHHVTPEKVVKAVNRGFRRGEVDFGIIARSILCCMRFKPEWSLDVIKLCYKNQEYGVVGIDLAGDEPLGEIPAAKEHVMAFEEARRLGIHRTVHAGEAGPAASVREALTQLHAERIGHGYHILDDPELYEEIVKKEIHLEVCPTSSILTGAVEPPLKLHPVRKFAEDRLNYSINSDDPLICNTNQEKEYKVSFVEIGLNAAELTRATFNAARASFLPDNEKQELLEYLREIHGITGPSEYSQPEPTPTTPHIFQF